MASPCGFALVPASHAALHPHRLVRFIALLDVLTCVCGSSITCRVCHVPRSLTPFLLQACEAEKLQP